MGTQEIATQAQTRGKLNPDYIPPRHNRDKIAPGSHNWGPELLGFCQQNNLLVLNGRTPGDEYGQFTFESAIGDSTVYYFIASVHCLTAAKSLHVLEEAGRYGTDHNPIMLCVACESLSNAPTPTPSAPTSARVRYDGQNAEAYRMSLESENWSFVKMQANLGNASRHK